MSEQIACHSIALLRPRLEQALAQRWGLAFFPNPKLSGFDANAFWCGSLYPRYITLRCRARLPGEHDELFEKVTKSCQIFHLTDCDGREHLLVKGNGCVVQVRMVGMSLLSPAPTALEYVTGGVATLKEKFRMIERAHERMLTEGPAQDPVWTRQSLAYRNALIALDAHKAGLSHFETAAVIYGRDRAKEAWDSQSDAMRGEVRRALKRGKGFRDGGYRDLLVGANTARRAA